MDEDDGAADEGDAVSYLVLEPAPARSSTSLSCVGSTALDACLAAYRLTRFGLPLLPRLCFDVLEAQHYSWDAWGFRAPSACGTCERHTMLIPIPDICANAHLAHRFAERCASLAHCRIYAPAPPSEHGYYTFVEAARPLLQDIRAWVARSASRPSSPSLSVYSSDPSNSVLPSLSLPLVQEPPALPEGEKRRPRIILVGSGFGGCFAAFLECALRLDLDVDVTLVTIGAPLRGTELAARFPNAAHFLWGRRGYLDVVPGAEMCERFEKHLREHRGGIPGGRRVAHFASTADWAVWPPERAAVYAPPKVLRGVPREVADWVPEIELCIRKELERESLDIHGAKSD